MTAMPIDPGLRNGDAIRRASACEALPDAMGRFADLLDAERAPVVAGPAAIASAPAPVDASSADPSLEATEGGGTPDAVCANARLFNQDGFFGRPTASTAAVTISHAAMPGSTRSPTPKLRPVEPDTVLVEAMPLRSGFPDQVRSDTKVRLTPASIMSSVTTSAAGLPRVAVPSATGVARASEPAPRRAAASRPVPLRPAPPPPVSAAVALYAAARGLEVVAQVAGLDERERAGLADKIAALLSAHGYPPARVSVIAAAVSATQQEHR